MIEKNGLKVHLIFLDNRTFKSEWKLTDEFNKEGKERILARNNIDQDGKK